MSNVIALPQFNTAQNKRKSLTKEEVKKIEREYIKAYLKLLSENK